MYNVVAYTPEEQRRGRNEADFNACDYSIKSEYFGVEGYPSGRKGAVLKTVLEQSNKSSNLLPSANCTNVNSPRFFFVGETFALVFDLPDRQTEN